MTIDSAKRHKQKCLLLINLKELHSEYCASTVHSFQHVVLQNLKGSLPNLKCRIYSSDGTPNQYQYLKNTANRNYHCMDYCQTEWQHCK